MAYDKYCCRKVVIRQYGHSQNLYLNFWNNFKKYHPTDIPIDESIDQSMTKYVLVILPLYEGFPGVRVRKLVDSDLTMTRKIKVDSLDELTPKTHFRKVGPLVVPVRTKKRASGTHEKVCY